MIRLGVVEVLNVLPVYYTVLKQNRDLRGVEIVKGRITELNHKLNQGEIDVSVISSFEYARNPHLYYIMPDLSVSADGPVRSIYLFLKKPIDELRRGDAIRLTAFSFTSVHLIQYILMDRGIRFTRKEEPGLAGELLIADEAIQRFYRRQDPYVYDLSQLWKEKTGLPFVFALWCARRDSYQVHGPAVNRLHQALVNSKHESMKQLSDMACGHYHGVFPDREGCEKYLANLKYEFSEPFQKGFRLFQEKMVALKKLSAVAPFAFLPSP